MIQFDASLHAIRLDREAEATVILKVPASDLKEVVELMKHTEQVMRVNVMAAEKVNEFKEIIES